MWGIHRWPVNSPRIGPVTRKNVTAWWRHHVFQPNCLMDELLSTWYIILVLIHMNPSRTGWYITKLGEYSISNKCLAHRVIIKTSIVLCINCRIFHPWRQWVFNSYALVITVISGAILYSPVSGHRSEFSEQWGHRWFGTPSFSLWRHCDG